MLNILRFYIPLEQELFKYNDDFYVYPILKPLLIKIYKLKETLENDKISLDLNLVVDDFNKDFFESFFKKILKNINIITYNQINSLDQREGYFFLLPGNTPLLSYNISILVDFIKDHSKQIFSAWDENLDLSNFSFIFKTKNWEILKKILINRIFNLKDLLDFINGNKLNENYIIKKEELIDKKFSNYFLRINNLKDIELIFEKSKEIVKEIYKEVVFLGNNIFICPLSYINKENLILDNVMIIDSSIEGRLNRIGPNSFIFDSKIGNKNVIFNSVVKGNMVMDENKIGPFSHLRENNEIGKNNEIGAFVELKNTKMNSKVKSRHLAYLGDAVLNENVNIGAGVVLANYDGINKYQTIIESNVFIGSNATIIAPRTIASNAYIGAGSVVTKDVESNTVVIGNPAKFYTTTEQLKNKKNNLKK
ncbi:MAG: DapH/DapD/GlmU-related protein [bacterium]